jgi:outer membrane murein-binding lipoprotein Lpp
MRTILTLTCVALILSGCSVAALVEENNLDSRIQALDARIHDLEIRQPPATIALKPTP